MTWYCGPCVFHPAIFTASGGSWESHKETGQQFWPAGDGAGLPVEWPQPGGHRRGWVGCSPGRSWSQSDGRRGGSDPFQLELGPHPCPAELNLRWSRNTSTVSTHLKMTEQFFDIYYTFTIIKYLLSGLLWLVSSSFSCSESSLSKPSSKISRFLQIKVKYC